MRIRDHFLGFHLSKTYSAFFLSIGVSHLPILTSCRDGKLSLSTNDVYSSLRGIIFLFICIPDENSVFRRLILHGKVSEFISNFSHCPYPIFLYEYFRYSRSPSPQEKEARRSGSRSRSRSLSRPKDSRERSRSQERTEEVNPGNSLYVTGLSTRVSERELDDHFSKEGKVSSCFLVVEPRTRISRGFAFVTMDSMDDADRCVKYLNQSVLDGRCITVEKSRRKSARTPTPGRYLGMNNSRDHGYRGRSRGGRDDYGYRRSPRRSSYEVGRGRDRDHNYSPKRSTSHERGGYSPRRSPPYKSGGYSPRRSPSYKGGGYSPRRSPLPYKGGGYSPRRSPPPYKGSGYSPRRSPPLYEGHGHSPKRSPPLYEGRGHTPRRSSPPYESRGHTPRRSSPPYESRGHFVRRSSPPYNGGDGYTPRQSPPQPYNGGGGGGGYYSPRRSSPYKGGGGGGDYSMYGEGSPYGGGGGRQYSPPRPSYGGRSTRDRSRSLPYSHYGR
ncbi:serine/arginine-rich splicing factor SR45a-like [Impatiens glandulifera]|uniref:serine/arginine-rich splicing factor SR45a-like n=1 Tax=Impatiens glandulifera TaxID=253017 RepID=UPI001FB0750D|nr:serine/arginine-rich splicing factor SR45a-like [Impatiens glandulifera]